ncbi:LYR motif containing protein 1-like isoform X2 [Saccoglossus kowalevskii]|uniref:LYR motif containing protein 1-like n=1 Tax=Saccoglossus kowalevskii TaxID=10224 RepID=A0ABM0GQL5_SACKO|nr:PREDICTED: LYR motif containing protein 1-like [Saccoglossus kowalevskii]
MAKRREVLSLYRQILRHAQKWESESTLPEDTKTDQSYIRAEARSLFKKNKEITEINKIDTCIKEAETRIQLALHYKNPHPRPVNIPYMGMPLSLSKGKKSQDRLRKQAKPLYLHSYDEQE